MAGGSTGKAFVYDARTGALVREVQLATGGGATFVNDVVVTKRAAFFTDSNRAVLYRLALSKNGAPARRRSALPLTGDFQLVAGLQPERHRRDAGREDARRRPERDREAVPRRRRERRDEGDRPRRPAWQNGDGILLHGRTLYVVQNQRQPDRGRRSRPRASRPARVARTITDPDFDVPTTIDRSGSRLYAVNARFGTTPGRRRRTRWCSRRAERSCRRAETPARRQPRSASGTYGRSPAPT